MIKDDRNPLDPPVDPIELGLQELDAAEQSGLFDRTRIDTRDLLQAASYPTPLWRRLPIGLTISAAAAIFLALGVGSYLFYSELETIRQHSTTTRYATIPGTSSSDCDGDFFECVTGPSRIVMAGCNRFDYDLDGDVDLTDFSTFQLACNGISR